MLRVLSRIPLYQLGRFTGWPCTLPLSLTLTPSPRCNSRCLTCNIWKKQADEMVIGEWEMILKKLGPAPYWITISGGEPFLYRDLALLVRACYEYCRPSIINIPTNGLLTERISGIVRVLAENCPKTQLIVNISLDGVGPAHDRIRGVPGNFARFEATFAALRELAQDFANLTLGVHSVVSAFNVGSIHALFEYILNLQPDSYVTEIAEERGELDTVGSGITPSLAEYASVVDDLLRTVGAWRFTRISRITQAFRLEYYRLCRQFLAHRSQTIPCYAGWMSAQIYADGTVWPCCVRADSMGNLRDAGYDLQRIWMSPEATRIRRSISAGECACPLANAAYTNMLCHVPTLARVAVNYLRG